jgi:hypothetical protein
MFKNMKILINSIGCIGKSTLRKKLSSAFPNNVIIVDMNYAKDIPTDTDKVVIVEATHSINEYPQVFDKILYMLTPKNHTFLLLIRGWVWFSTGKVYLSHLQGKQKPFALSNIPVILKILSRTIFLKKRWVRDDLDLIKKKFESKTYISHAYNEGYKTIKSWITNYINISDLYTEWSAK